MSKNSKTTNKKSQKKFLSTKAKKIAKVDSDVVANPNNSISELTPDISKDFNGLTDAEQKRIEDLITHARIEYAKIQSNIIKEKKREIDSLYELVKEFMGPYMLIGYDLNNNPVEIIAASSQAQHDALLERLRRLMFKINQNIINSNGEDPYGLNS